MAAISPSSKPHYPILDGLRGVAAILVVCFHIFETHATSHLDQVINHGYLAVDFFFLLSGFVIGYAYDDRWPQMSLGSFFKRRLIRLQPMVVLGMIVGAICFYFQAGAIFPDIQHTPVWKVWLLLVIGCTLIPVPPAMDIRGWREMHPLNGPGWSLFFEYIGNILYALVVRKFSTKALAILVGLSAAALLHLGLTKFNGDIVGGWSLDLPQLHIGTVRMMYPFFAGLLLQRISKIIPVKNAFGWCSLLLIIMLAMPRIGGANHLWMNGLYDALTVIVVFPLIVYLGAGGSLQHPASIKLCNFLGKISYPIYITHYPLIYIYTAWVTDHHLSVAAAFPYNLLLLIGSIALAYACLKWYDEPVRKWLNKKLNTNS